MSRLSSVLALLLISACGGGGGGGSSGSVPAPEPPPSDPGTQPVVLEVIDANPASTVTNADPSASTANFAHYGHSDLVLTLSGDCSSLEGTTIRRTLLDHSGTEFDQVLDHRIRCVLSENTAFGFSADGTRANDAQFIAEHGFSTGVANPLGLNVIQQIDLQRTAIDNLFLHYLGGALQNELDLPSAVENIILASIAELAVDNWDNLVDPEALYDVRSQQVTYLSQRPDGSPDAMLSGLVSFPITATAVDFSARDKMIVLTHATGSTPGDLNFADAWFILANFFAARGYLVVAPDNYGRGETDSEPETYLMASRTALNALHLIEQVLSDTSYDEIYSGSDLTIIGYSQGGHSAVGLWVLLETQGPDTLNVREVYAGGAPHNLYQTVRGVLQHIDGSCNGNGYCRYVDQETTVPFATNRILPGLLTYTNAGFSIDDAVVNDEVSSDLVSGVLANDPAYDKFKALLQLSSFTDVVSAEENFDGSDTLLHLYHSEFDRLVPLANSEELVAILDPVVTVDFHENRCNSDGYELIFNSTGKVGVVHTLCGLAVLDDALEDLK